MANKIKLASSSINYIYAQLDIQQNIFIQYLSMFITQKSQIALDTLFNDDVMIARNAL